MSTWCSCPHAAAPHCPGGVWPRLCMCLGCGWLEGGPSTCWAGSFGSLSWNGGPVYTTRPCSGQLLSVSPEGQCQTPAVWGPGCQLQFLEQGRGSRPGEVGGPGQLSEAWVWRLVSHPPAAGRTCRGRCAFGMVQESARQLRRGAEAERAVPDAGGGAQGCAAGPSGGCRGQCCRPLGLHQRGHSPRLPRGPSGPPPSPPGPVLMSYFHLLDVMVKFWRQGQAPGWRVPGPVTELGQWGPGSAVALKGLGGLGVGLSAPKGLHGEAHLAEEADGTLPSGNEQLVTGSGTSSSMAPLPWLLPCDSSPVAPPSPWLLPMASPSLCLFLHCGPSLPMTPPPLWLLPMASSSLFLPPLWLLPPQGSSPWLLPPHGSSLQHGSSLRMVTS